MKSIRTILAAFFVIAGLAASAQNTITANEAHVTITGQTTREQLAQLRADLHAQGMDFQYSPVFNGNRQLESISFTVKANDGQLTGTGDHKTLQNPVATLTFHVNKSAGTFSVDVAGDKTKP
jgi:hypothetical protein